MNVEAGGQIGMASRQELAAALAEAQQLEAEWQGRLGTAMALMASETWTGTSAVHFGQWLAGLSQSFKADLAGLVADVQNQLPAGSGSGQSSVQAGSSMPGTPYP